MFVCIKNIFTYRFDISIIKILPAQKKKDFSFEQFFGIFKHPLVTGHDFLIKPKAKCSGSKYYMYRYLNNGSKREYIISTCSHISFYHESVSFLFSLYI